ncbi:unnamed protein product [Fusarium graminearum]|uniref:Uncharacterized protein n=1 Tax=Gibberella zeae TaxID=5518 RepID=A0A9N8REM1_GIBZA|nr:unnamed protein product [Fusarium graminearum]
MAVRPHVELVSVIVYLPQTRTLESDNDWYASDDAFVGEHNGSMKCAPGWYCIYYRIETVFPFFRLLTCDIHSSNMDTKHCLNLRRMPIHWVSRLASATQPLKYRNLQQLPSLSDVCLCEIHAPRTLPRSKLLQAMNAMLLLSQIALRDIRQDLRAMDVRKRTSDSEPPRQKSKSCSISDAGDSWDQVCLVDAQYNDARSLL